MIAVSILMATTPNRATQFTDLFNELHAQIQYCKTVHPTLGDVEVLVDDRPKFLDGGPSVGVKRNDLLKRASGKYLLYLDSDESISPQYIETILRLCRQDQDVCTFRALVKLKNFWALVDMRLAYQVNDQINPDYDIRRPCWHVCPIRSIFAKLYSFEDKNNAEDFEWVSKVLKHCTTEAHTERIIFCYNHGDHSEVDKIPLP